MIDFARRWSERTEIPAERFIRWLGIGTSKFYDWRGRYGRVNEHNAWVPRDHWLTPAEREAILAPIIASIATTGIAGSRT